MNKSGQQSCPRPWKIQWFHITGSQVIKSSAVSHCLDKSEYMPCNQAIGATLMIGKHRHISAGHGSALQHNCPGSNEDQYFRTVIDKYSLSVTLLVRRGN